MKKTILIVLFLNTYALLQAQTKVEYVCPMHAQIVRSKPGKCPICGMTLVKKNTPSATKKVMPRSEDSLHNNNSQKAGSTDSIQAQNNMDMKDEMQG